MYKLRIVFLVLFLPLSFVQNQLIAMDWLEGNYNLPNPEWPGGSESLNTYNYVSVKMFNGGYVSQYNMYDSSELSMFNGYISELNLYSNATAALYGGNIYKLFVSSESSGWVKLYAYDVDFMPSSGPSDGGSVMGYWLSNNQQFHIGFLGDSVQGEITCSYIQIIPEPATFALLGLGAFAGLRKRK